MQTYKAIKGRHIINMVRQNGIILGVMVVLVLVAVEGRRGGSRQQSWVGYCDVPHCDECKTHTRCGQCEHGYFEDDWECFSCTEIHSQCDECSDGNTCTECAKGYHLSGGSCQKCPEGCASCSSQDVCDSCEAGYGEEDEDEGNGEEGEEGVACVECENQIENCKHCSAPEGSSGTNVVLNHSFELPQIAFGTNILPQDWTLTNIGGFISAPFIDIYPNAPDGSQALNVVRFTDGTTYEMSQSVAGLTPGQECTFSFFYKAYDSFFPNVANLLFKIGGTEVASVFTTDDTNWQQETGTFTPSSDTMTIAFTVQIEDFGDYDIDDVEVVCPPPPSGCTDCIPGFFVSESACASCPETYGSQCNECDESECTGCTDSFYLNTDNDCVTCEEKFEHCKKCSSDGDECEECEKGYKFIDGACVYNDKYYGQQTCAVFLDDFHCEWVFLDELPLLSDAQLVQSLLLERYVRCVQRRASSKKEQVLSKFSLTLSSELHKYLSKGNIFF